jgi:hypothetical protein
MFDQVDAKSGRNRSWPGRLFAGLAVVTALVVLAGCGSSSSSSSSSSSTSSKVALTKTQFLAQGNAICTQGNKSLAASEKALGNSPTDAQFVAFLSGPFKTEIQKQIDAIRALGAPTADQSTVTHMLDVAQSDLDSVTANPKAAEAAKTSPFKNFSQLAHAYGLTVCAAEN